MGYRARPSNLWQPQLSRKLNFMSGSLIQKLDDEVFDRFMNEIGLSPKSSLTDWEDKRIMADYLGTIGAMGWLWPQLSRMPIAQFSRRLQSISRVPAK
jgi:hypothetical protein